MEPFSPIRQLTIEKEVVGLFISGHPLDQYKLEIDSFTNIALPALSDLESLKGRSELRMAGSVSGFAHRTTKNGKPFGTLTLEDYHGAFTFFLFGDDYVKFKHYFMSGWFVYLTGLVTQKKWGNENELEFKITSISLLSEIRGKMIKGLKVTINLDDLTYDLMEKLETISTKYKGDAKLYIEVIEQTEKISLELFSKNYTIDPSTEMIRELNLLPEVFYKVMDR
jgi:DNA polymerase-3 subunit alpha